MVQDILREIRIRTGDVEAFLFDAMPELSDIHLFEFIRTASRYLYAVGILNIDYSFSVDPDTDELLVSPTPFYIDVLLIATYALYLYMTDDLKSKIVSGELGVRFRSGQDEISTIEASRQLANVTNDIFKEYRSLVMAKLSGVADAYFRAQ